MAPVAVKDLAIRYWYTLEGSEAEQFHCDYAKIGSGNVSGAFYPTSGMNADHYLEITFTAPDVLAAGGETGEIQARFNKSNFSNYDETNDYSFDPTKLAFEPWIKVGLYFNGSLVWGEEPPP
jgi:cellulose binding protein with CBM3 domain